MEEAVEALARHCTGITIIGLDGCTNLTNAAVQELGQRCTSITFIDMRDCTNITDAAVQELKASRPGVIVIR